MQFSVWADEQSHLSLPSDGGGRLAKPGLALPAGVVMACGGEVWTTGSGGLRSGKEYNTRDQAHNYLLCMQSMACLQTVKERKSLLLVHKH